MQFTINISSRNLFLGFVIAAFLLLASLNYALVGSGQTTASTIDAPDHRSRLMPFDMTVTTTWAALEVPQGRITKSIFVEVTGSNSLEIDLDHTNTTQKSNGRDLELSPGDTFYDLINTQSFRFRAMSGSTTFRGYYTFGGL